MPKSMIVSIRPEWLQMILNGEKEFEFRNWKVPVGTALYFYCTKGKLYLHHRPTENCTTHYVVWDKPSVFHTTLNGKVVAKAVVDEVYIIDRTQAVSYLRDFVPLDVQNHINKYDCAGGMDDKIIDDLDIIDLNKLGYTNQKYALKLKNIEPITPRKITSFTKANGEQLQHAPQSRVWVEENLE